MQSTWKIALGALVAALSLASTGCPSNPCDGKCTTSQTCNTHTNKCEDKDPCGGACQPGTGCNPATAACENLCSLPTAPHCTLPETCQPETGKCANKCTGVSCADASKACNPATGACEDACALAGCSATQMCDASTNYACANKCDSNTQPHGKAACENGWTCEQTTGECVPPCANTTCADGQWCDDATGACKTGAPPAGYPGTACTSDGDCHVPNSNLTYTCATSDPLNLGIPFPGGYCTATCSATALCPNGSTCIDLTQYGYGAGCFQTCSKDADCGSTDRCVPAAGILGSGGSWDGKYVCWPSTECTKTDPSQCGGIGADCGKDEDCQNGDQCLAETFTDPTNPTAGAQYSGFLGGYCFRVERGGSGGDSCPTGSTQVQVDPNDTRYTYCLKDCTVGEIGSGCSTGEACLQASQNSTTAGVCWSAECSVDNDCQVAQCSTTDTTKCGKGQACQNGFCKTADSCQQDSDCCLDSQCTYHSTCDTSTHTCSQTFCDGSLGICQYDCTVLDAYSDTDGSCAGVTCPVGQVCDKTQPAGSNCVSPVCPDGTTCNATTKHCDRSCKTDDNCGTNAVCEGATAEADGTCVTYCTKYNESEVCSGGNVCNYATGHCQAKCTSDAACSDGERCDSASGHCVARCDADPTVCSSSQYCDTGTGACQTKCTAANESTVCSADKLCQTSTGMCLPDCSTDPSICGAEACNVNSVGANRCGQTCTSDSQCGHSPDNVQLTCQTAPDNANIKRCQLPPS